MYDVNQSAMHTTGAPYALGDVRDRAPAVQALALYDATRAAAPSQHVAVIGSPGMGVTRAADLHTSARIWAVQSVQDWIYWIPAFQVWGTGHGRTPTTQGFGDRVFGTGGVSDHDHYLSSGTQSLANIVEIVLGRDTAVSAPGSSAATVQASG